MTERPKALSDCHFYVRFEPTEDGDMWVGRCVQFPDVAAFSDDVAEAMGLTIDAVECLIDWDVTEKNSG